MAHDFIDIQYIDIRIKRDLRGPVVQGSKTFNYTTKGLLQDLKPQLFLLYVQEVVFHFI